MGRYPILWWILGYLTGEHARLDGDADPPRAPVDGRTGVRGPRAQPNSMALYSDSLCSGCRASIRRTVPDLDRMTRDWVLAPNSS